MGHLRIFSKSFVLLKANLLARYKSLVLGILIGVFSYSALHFMSNLAHHHNNNVYKLQKNTKNYNVKRKPVYNNAKILCIVITTTPSDINSWNKIISISHTWGKRCQKVEFHTFNYEKNHGSSDYYDEDDEEESAEINALKNNLEHLFNSKIIHHNHSTWTQNKIVWKSIYERNENFDWILFSSTDSFFIMESLRYFLSNKNPHLPQIYGHLLQESKQKYWVDKFLKYPSEKPGFLFSRGALDKMYIETHKENSSCNWEFYNNITFGKLLGKCIKAIGINLVDMRSNDGELLFLPLRLSYFYQINQNATKVEMKSLEVLKKLEENSAYKFESGLHKKVSRSAIGFYGLRTSRQLFDFEYKVYSIKLYDKIF